MSFSCLELFSGIGGFAVAAEVLGWRVARAIDIDQHAGEVYRANFAHDHQVRTIESIPLDDFADMNADLWWMSPPCQPFTQRGAQRGLGDARCEAFLHIVKAIRTIKPRFIAMENVPPFGRSTAAEHIRKTLDESAYQRYEWELCPSEMGIPNRRRRFYLVASRDRAPTPRAFETQGYPLKHYLDAEHPELKVPATKTSGFRNAMDRIDPNDLSAVAACFTSAYGKSPVQSGSYLETGDRLRLFSPQEILRLLGFPEGFQLPETLSLRQQWKLIGNSLSVPVVQHCLSALV